MGTKGRKSGQVHFIGEYRRLALLIFGKVLSDLDEDEIDSIRKKIEAQGETVTKTKKARHN